MIRSIPFSLPAVVTACALALAGPAAASTVTASWELTISGNTNVPSFRLDNTSSPGLLLTQFSITIGDTSRHWDLRAGQSVLGDPPSGGTMSLAPGFGVTGTNRADEAILTFTSFDPGDFATWTLDVDLDPATNSVEDYRTVMFNNGSNPNSIGTATFESTLFADPLTVALTLPDGSTTATSYTFTASQTFASPTAVIPLPPALPLLASGLLGLALLGRRRRGA